MSRSQVSGPYYDGGFGKSTLTVYCASIDGDYVLNRGAYGGYYTADSGNCSWAGGSSSESGHGIFAALFPDSDLTELSFPQWRLNCRMNATVRRDVVYEWCEGPCSTFSWVVTGVSDSPIVEYDWGGAIGPYYEQHCSPPLGVILDDLPIVAELEGGRHPVTHTCLFTVEIV
jgi:hypothetical protein